MAKVVFVVPALQVDATWDPARRAPFIGVWAMASLLRERGHEVWYLDEAVRGGAWNRRCLSRRRLVGATVREEPMGMTWAEWQAGKMRDFAVLSSSAFVAKYSAFRSDQSVDRSMCRIGVPLEETLEHLASIGPDAVGIPLVASANYLPATELGRAIKQRWPQCKVFLGGQHITADPSAFLAANPWVDYIADGDAITTVEGMVLGRHLQKIVPGGFRTMDEYPLLDYEFVAKAGYPEVPTHNLPSGLRTVEYMSSRGCYRDCAFCFAGRKEQQVTQSEWERVTRQLDHFCAHGCKEVIFQDDAWLAGARKRFPVLLALLKERGLSFSNNGGVEFESFVPDVARMIADYNDGTPGQCVSLYVPFNPRGWNAATTAAASMTQKYHRNLESLAIVRRAGVYVFTSLIVGTPDQTLESYEEDLATTRWLIQEGYLDSALPLSATMLPGTEWHSRNGYNIVHPLDWAGFSLFTTHHRTDHMLPRDIERLMVRTVKELGDVQQAGPWQTAFPSGSSV